MAGAVEEDGMTDGRCDRCGNNLTTGDVNGLCRACDALMDKRYPNAYKPPAPPKPATSAWRTDEPPIDGKMFLAVIKGWAEENSYPQVLFLNRYHQKYTPDGLSWVDRNQIIAWAAISPYGGDDGKR